jgi:hypothetical protein
LTHIQLVGKLFLESACSVYLQAFNEGKIAYHLSECGNEPAGHHMRFEVLMAMNTEIKINWDMISCGLLNRYQMFRGTCCLHLPRQVNAECYSKMLVPTYKAIQGQRLVF